MSDTKTDNTKAIQKRKYERTKKTGLDDYIEEYLLTKTFGEVFDSIPKAKTVKAALAADMIYNATIPGDVGIIAELVKRLDGTAPTKEDAEWYSHIFGDAIEDVLESSTSDAIIVRGSDPAIIALAKSLVSIAARTDSITVLDSNGKEKTRQLTVQERKDRQKAIQIILERTEGRKSEPEQLKQIVEYVAPEWLSLEGETKN